MHTHDPYDDPNWRDRETLKRLFDKHDGNVSAIARDLEVDRGTVRDWLDHHDIREPEQLPLAKRIRAGDFDDAAADAGGRSA